MIHLHYGTSGLRFPLPSEIRPFLIQKQAMPLLQDTHKVVDEMFNKPIACENIEKLCKDKKTVCIVICDITRPVPNHLFLQPLVRRLLQAGIKKENICVLIATGLHRPNLGDELKQLIQDDWVLSEVEVVNHFARDDAMHSDLGQTRTRHTPIKIDKRFVQADLKIVTGLVEPHLMAGYSGGRKVIAPGIAHADTITTFHNHRFMSDLKAVNCNLVENPLHEEQLEIVEKLSPVYAINTVIDEQRRLAYINFGEIVQSHIDAVNFVRKYAEIPTKRKFKNILTTSAGEPLDKTFYQTIKGLVAVLDIMEEGGHLVVASSCREGLGSAEFKEAQARLIKKGASAFLEEISHRSRATIDEWQTQMLTKVLAKCQIHLFSEHFTEEDFVLSGAKPVHNLAATMKEISQITNSLDWAIIPEGPYVVPLFKP